jgi:MFS family permease
MRNLSGKTQFHTLYLVKFAENAGFIALITLLPTYINLLNPSGIAIGLFITGFTAARAVAVVPLGWAGDRYDKRTLLLGSIVVSAGAYALFPFVETSSGFIVVRFLQGLGIVGVGLLSLSLVGELASDEGRAKVIGTFNSWKLAAGVLATIGAGALYERYGFTVIFTILVVLLLVAAVGTWLFIEPDDTSVSFAFDDLAVNPRILTISSFRVQYAFAVTFVRNWVPIFVGVSAAQGGLGFAASVVGVTMAAERFTNMVCQPFTGGLADRYGRSLFLFIGGGSYGLLAFTFPATPVIGNVIDVPSTYPVVGTVSATLIAIVALHSLVGVADAFREPASMALFADEGVDQGGITSSFGIRSLVWRPGNLVAPLIGGVVMTQFGIEWVFYIAGFFAVSGSLTFLGALVYAHGRHPFSGW